MIFEALRRERRARFAATGRSDILDDPSFLAFYRAVIFDARSPFAVLSALKAGDRILATLFAVRHDDCYLLLMHSFEPELAALSPGIVAIDETITSVIEAGGRFFDFTIGDEDYKRQFGVREEYLTTGLDALSLQGQLYVRAHRSAKRGRNALAPLVSLGRNWVERTAARMKSAARAPASWRIPRPGAARAKAKPGVWPKTPQDEGI